jgi:hypothetical protein
MEGDRRCAQWGRMEGDTGDKGDKGGPGECKKEEPPVSAIVLMAEEAVERERRRGPRKMDNRISAARRRGPRKMEDESALRNDKFYKNENRVLSFLEKELLDRRWFDLVVVGSTD